jgi:prefoldin subunit 5
MVEPIEQEPSIEEAINKLDKSKDSYENELEELKQQLKETK